MSRPADCPFWIQRRLATAASAHRLDLNGQAALFCERGQQLFQLNPTAAHIWDELADGRSCQSIVEDLASEGLPSSDALNFVVGITEKWLAAGHVVPADIVSETENRPREKRQLSVGSANLLLQFFGDADVRSVDRVFGHLQAVGALPLRRLDVVERSSAYFLISDGQPLGMTSSVQVNPFLKAFLTEACCEATLDGFLAHGALVSRNDTRVFITGPPGAGKTTLAMALVSSGFSFCGDDIVHIDSAGQATALPFAAAIKSGAWALLDSLCPEMRAADVHERADGQLVRYVVPEKRDTVGARAIDVVVVLARDMTSSLRTEQLQPLDSLYEILKSGYSPNRRIDARTIQALAKNLSQASHHRLIYSDLAGAVAKIAAWT